MGIIRNIVNQEVLHYIKNKEKEISNNDNSTKSNMTFVKADIYILANLIISRIEELLSDKFIERK